MFDMSPGHENYTKKDKLLAWAMRHIWQEARRREKEFCEKHNVPPRHDGQVTLLGVEEEFFYAVRKAAWCRDVDALAADVEEHPDLIVNT